MQQILTHKPQGRWFDFRAATLGAAQLRGVSTFRIGLDVLLLGRGRGKLTSQEYFLEGAWQPGLNWAQRRAFLGLRAGKALNLSLQPPFTPELRQKTQNKFAAASGFQAAGLAMPRRLGIVAAEDPGSGAEWLSSREALTDFLQRPGILPCFGKPVFGSTGRGAVSLIGLEPDGRIRLGNGQTVPLAALVQEIWETHARGFLFEELQHPHPDLARMIGPVIGTLRVVTVHDGSAPEVLYTVQKMPGKAAMVDSSAGPLGGYAAIDTYSGRVLRLQDRRRLGGTPMEANHVTGAPMVGETLPEFDAALAAARAAHATLPELGVLGIDMFLTDKGPVMTEVNSSPFHSVYQAAFARGLLNPDLLPKLQRVRERFRAITPRPKDGPLP
ncbi:sugar-transfer associated ATP-grasp domain-containing protein [Tabrizicola caldifontis]|uniref:sugar-transfer associated ATP-grasp domain-containing protein n=1 Tax=Tabrizicola caldifontis TaxID=2528036 RepID=UPI0010819DDE|nr:sugar-transfer associated ATP-grasp domain-containing protein [Rhodobacter sp. YIM 73028]